LRVEHIREIILYTCYRDGAIHKRGRAAAEKNPAQIGAAPTNYKASELVADIGDHSRAGFPL